MKMMIFMAILLLPCAFAQSTEKRRTGNTCTQDDQCPDNAFCRSKSYCVCKDGFIFAASASASTAASPAACLKAGKHGDPCQIDVQCHTTMGVHAECLLGTCACQPKSQLVGDRCYRKAVVGERCLTDGNCFVADAQTEQQAFCVRGFCACQINYSPRDNNTRCVRDAELGGVCLDDDQCAAVGLECVQTRCQCRQGFAAHVEANVCIESVTALGGACEYDVQCASLAGVKDPKSADAAMCLGGQCSCGFNARTAGDPPRCYLIRRPGQPCKADQECLNEEDEPGFCRRGRCTCHGCVPDESDFDGAGALAPIPLVAAILAAAAVLV